MTGPAARSVNLRDDIGAPERLAHYQPTRRSLPVLQAVLNGGATMAIAPYGSGKSLAAGVGGLFVLNRDPALPALADRLRAVDARAGDDAWRRIEDGGKGRVAVLTGHCRDLPGALSDALGMPRKRGIEPVLDALDCLAGADRVAIVWDEFGRHLEGIVGEGRARELDAVQRLAEWAVRARGPSASLTLLLHQNLLAYAGALNQASRNEWRKVEGRFAQLRFVEDSQEAYELAAAAIARRRPAGLVPPDADALRPLARRAVEAGWFDGMTDEARVAGLLGRAFPVSAAALQVLPRLVARVGQNERSLFAFIDGADLSGPVGMEEVYAAFSDALRSDVGIGGAHRRWVEAETARSRAADGTEREALAAACLLQLGADGERRRLTRAALETAVASRAARRGERLDAPAAERQNATTVVGGLIARKLLLHRTLNDDVSIWHGADLDLPGRIREERARRFEGFDLLAFLAAHHPAPAIRPTRHNLAFGTARFLRGEYVRAADIAAAPGRLPGGPPASEWGRVLFVLADSAEELARARAAAENGWPGWDRTLVALPADPVPVGEAAFEVDALLALQGDDGLRAADPLVGQEIAELLAVARRQLSAMLHRLTTDRPAAAEWWCRGARLDVSADRPAGMAASALLDNAYGATPRILNDQVMRNRLSRQMETARVRLLTRLLEKAHAPQIGYRPEELSSAEGSIYRTVLEATGLHCRDGEAARFAEPSELANPGLRQAWALIAEFFRVPGTKSLQSIVASLSAPPIGLPAGVIPILVVAGFKAFASAASLRTDGAYVADLLGFEASRLFLEPARTTVEVHANDEATLSYLSELAYVFSHRRPAVMEERVSFAVGALAAWRATLSDGVKRSQRHTDDSRFFLRLLSQAENMPRMLVHGLPEAFGARHLRSGRFGSTLKAIETARNDIERLIDGYARNAAEVVGEVLSLHAGTEPLAGVQAWVRCFDVPAFLQREDVTIVDKAILRTARDTIDGRCSAESLARAISSILLHRGPERWEDNTTDQMRRLLRECRTRIEDAALSSSKPDPGLMPVLEARLRNLEAKLRSMKAATVPLRAVAGIMG